MNIGTESNSNFGGRYVAPDQNVALKVGQTQWPFIINNSRTQFISSQKILTILNKVIQ